MKLLLYCTKAKPYITRGNDSSVYPSCVISDGIKEWHLNGKIVAECDFEVEEIDCKKADKIDRFYKYSRLTYRMLDDYLKGKKGYAIHIKNLHIFDKPRGLDFYSSNFDYFKKVEKAPQNMMKVWEDQENPFVLISIQPQWLCKILNGEKTIECRKKILKGMIK